MALVFEANPYRTFCGLIEFSTNPKEFFSVCEVAASIAKEVFSQSKSIAEGAKVFSNCGKILVLPHVVHEVGDLVLNMADKKVRGFSSFCVSMLSVVYDAIQLLNLYSNLYAVDPISLALPQLNVVKTLIALLSTGFDLNREIQELKDQDLSVSSNGQYVNLRFNISCGKAAVRLPDGDIKTSHPKLEESLNRFLDNEKRRRLSILVNKLSIVGLCSMSLLSAVIISSAIPVIQGGLATSYLASTISKDYYKYFHSKQIELYKSNGLTVASTAFARIL